MTSTTTEKVDLTTRTTDKVPIADTTTTNYEPNINTNKSTKLALAATETLIEIVEKTPVKETKIKVLANEREFDRNDPIIIPTVTYMNNTDLQKTDNHLDPLVFKGELIVQKPPTKVPKKDTEVKKKTYPRRKGNLKSTYGDKHEKFFATVMNASIALNDSEKFLSNKVKITNSKIINEPFKVIKKIDLKPLPSKNEKLSHESTSHIAEVIKHNKTVVNTVTKEVVPNNINKTEISNVNTSMTNGETTTAAHPIVAVTFSNIKNIFHRTKKPKDDKPLKKPTLLNNANSTEIIKADTVIKNIPEKTFNTKLKNETQGKSDVKPLKSINKEIHKIPSTPISETSKALDTSTKLNIAPENRGGFEILDKNNVWELLKEGKDIDNVKSEEKLQVHKLNMLVHNVSSSDESRSL